VRKRKTEVGSVVTELKARADRHGLRVPLVEAVGRMIVEIEAGARQMSWDNIRALREVNAREHGRESEGESNRESGHGSGPVARRGA
jgi:hypothetical protein